MVRQSHLFTSLLKMKRWVQAHRITSLSIVGTSLIMVAGGISYAVLSQPMPPPDTTPIAVKVMPKPPVYYSPLTGLKVKSEAVTKQAVTAVMVENSPDARPQSGLKEAGVVFEAIAEGGITRFLTLHQEGKPTLIGPVRSVRIYYVDWLAPFNASVAHVGGSPDGLREIRNGNYRDIDQFFNAGSYWRSTDRYAPHNVYTNFKKLDALNKSKGYKTSKFEGFIRTDEAPSEKPNATSIKINISSQLYNTAYTYDKKRNRYNRSLAGIPHVDREKGRIVPKVVIALHVNRGGPGQSIKTTGSGKATIFQNGTVIKATWKKKTRKSQLHFVDSNGIDIPLVRGQTWISAVPNGSGSVTWK